VLAIILLGLFYIYAFWYNVPNVTESITNTNTETKEKLVEKSVLKTFFDLGANAIDGTPIHFSTYTGSVVLVVNVASEWGLTEKNYKQLVDLHNRYYSKGLRILAFPCNQFGAQEPGTEKEILEFANNYGAKFQLFSKVVVNQVHENDKVHPVFEFLKKRSKTEKLDWNFCKFLVARNGLDVKFYKSSISPKSLIPDIERLLVVHHENDNH
jgi:glutathione peroxidase-family protein